MLPMHEFDEGTERLARAIEAYARDRIAKPQPLDGSASPEELWTRAGETITARGIGGKEALRIWAEVLAPATISADNPAFLAFVPGAPTRASILFDLVLSASSTYGGSWLEGAGAVWVENQTLRWLADLAGLPATAGGCFVSGGTAGNLSALVAARHRAASRIADRPLRWKVAAADTAHSSVASSAAVMDADLIEVPHDDRGRLTGALLAETLDAADVDGSLRGRGKRGIDECRRRGRPRRGGRSMREARNLAACRRGVRRRRAPGSVFPRPLPGHRPGGFVHRRSPQVALRAV